MNPIIVVDNQGGASALLDQAPAVINLRQFNAQDRLLVFNVHTTNGQGGTPTAPGANKQFKFFYAFHDEGNLTLADVPTLLATKERSLNCDLPNSNSSAAAGQRHHSTVEPVLATGDYMYVWYDIDALVANSLIDARVTARIVQ
jgi:hypothetical protein